MIGVVANTAMKAQKDHEAVVFSGVPVGDSCRWPPTPAPAFNLLGPKHGLAPFGRGSLTYPVFASGR